jgi:molybdopterin-guanine dinucleotide biosynthesis protein A
MGADKALARFHGVPLLQRALDILGSAGFATGIAGLRSPLEEIRREFRWHHLEKADAPPADAGLALPAICPDAYPNMGPLGGVHAALAATATDWNVFLPVDLPLMPPTLLACLAARAAHSGLPVTLTRLNDRIEPFPVVLHRCVLPAIEHRLESAQTACHAAWLSIPEELDATLDTVSVEDLLQAGQIDSRHPPVFWYQGANTPSELRWLEGISAGSP